MNSAYFFAATMVLVASLLWAEFRQISTLRWIAKPSASAGFVAVALANNALATDTGVWIVVGLLLCMLGDILLIPRHNNFFLAGMGAFAAGHIAYIIAFLSVDPEVKRATYIAAASIFVGGSFVLYELWRPLNVMRAPVAIYTLIISFMVVASTMATPADTVYHQGFIVGAVAFAISDIFVARDQFLAQKFFNKALGLPLYYGAQLVLASSV